MNLQIQILQYLETIRTEFLTVVLTVVTIMAEKIFLVGMFAILAADALLGEKAIMMRWHIIAVILVVLISAIFTPRYDLFNAIRYAVVFLWITTRAPYLFKGFSKPSQR